MKYLGNKKRLIEFLTTTVDTIGGERKSFLDLFAGTGAVSRMMSKTFDLVDSVDVLEISKAMTISKTNKTPSIPPSIVQDFNNKEKDGFITNHYSEKVGVCIFKTEIAKHIDGCISLLREIQQTHQLTVLQYYFLLESVLDAADFRSNIMGSYESFYKRGWRKQAETPWEIEITQTICTSKSRFFKQSVESFLQLPPQKNYSLIYLDSPYNSRQYSSVFHVLETIANLTVEAQTKGRVNKPENLYISAFSRKSQVETAFSVLFRDVSSITDNVLVSYSNEGLISIEKLISLMESYFIVERCEMDYRKFNTNRKKSKNTVTEFLLHGKR